MLYTVWFINSANHNFNFSQMHNECTTSHLLYFSCTLQTNVYVRPLPRFHSCFVFDALKLIKGRMIKSFHLPFCAQPHLVRRWITEKSLEDNLDEISSPQWWNPIAIKTRHKLLLWNTHLSSLLLLSISVGDFIFPVSLNGLNYLLILVCSQ